MALHLQPRTRVGRQWRNGANVEVLDTQARRRVPAHTLVLAIASGGASASSVGLLPVSCLELELIFLSSLTCLANWRQTDGVPCQS